MFEMKRKLEASEVLALAQGKMLVNRADSHTSAARFVRQRFLD
jgi:hypothetical protein